MMLFMTFLSLFIAVVVFMTGWFVIARLTDRIDVVDTAWGLGFVYVALLAWLTQGTPSGVPLLTLLFVAVWGFRLAWHLASRNFARSTDDHRYLEYRNKWSDKFWPSAYVRIFLLQGFLLLIISSTAVASILSLRNPTVWLAIAGFVIWGGGIVYESVADWQLRQFVKTKKPGEIMQTKLWRYSRHPNYFGEVTAWWGAAIVAVSVGQWWGIIGAIVITTLITKISGVPLLEKRYAANPAFHKYAQRTSVLIPLPPQSGV
jgi:steroid 5-alpha reductase family enzyme